VELENGGLILCRTMEKEERLVGFEVGSALLDELDIMPTDKAITAFRKVLGRLRSKYPDGSPNRVMVTSTPEGFKALYKIFVKGKTDNHSLIHGSTYENAANLPEGYIDALVASYPPQLIQAYLNGQFVNLTSGRVYPNFTRQDNHADVTPREGETLHVGMDFNVNFGASAIHVIRDGKAYAVDEIHNAYDTEAQLDALKERYPKNPVFVYPDASGKNRKSSNTTQTDIYLIQQAGFKIMVDNANPPIKTRVHAFNGMILNGKGERRYFVNVNRCPNLTEALEAQIYDSTNMPDKAMGFDHITDAAVYFIHQRFPVLANTPTLHAVAMY
jgi:phage terminase large subunit